MEKSEVLARVVKVTCAVLNIDAEMIKSESNFVFDLGAESTQSIELVAGFEEEFDIEMDQDDALEDTTLEYDIGDHFRLDHAAGAFEGQLDRKGAVGRVHGGADKGYDGVAGVGNSIEDDNGAIADDEHLAK